MAVFRNGVYQSCQEVIDGNEYHACDFANCQLVYRGGNLPTIVGCKFGPWTPFFADAAGRTLEMLNEMYNGLPGGKEIVERVFDDIRKPKVKAVRT